MSPESCSGDSGFLAPGRGKRCWVPWGMQGPGGLAGGVLQQLPQHVPNLGMSVASPGQSSGMGACRPSLPSRAPWGHPDLAQGLSPSPAPHRDGCSAWLPRRDAGMLRGSARGCCFSLPVLGPAGPPGWRGAAPPWLPIPVTLRLRPSPPQHLLLLSGPGEAGKAKPRLSGSRCSREQPPRRCKPRQEPGDRDGDEDPMPRSRGDGEGKHRSSAGSQAGE